MAKPRWVGEHLWNLLNLPLAELARLYPGYTKNTLKGKKAYWKQKLKEGKVTMPPKPEATPNTPVTEGRLVKSWEVAMRGQDGEWDTTTLHSYDHTGGLGEEFVPATPARITPSRRKPAVRDYRTLFVFSDAQIDYRRMEDGSLEPIHDERAIRAAQLLCRDLQPDEIINLGDTVDLAALSRFKKDSDHFQRTLGPAFQRVHDMYAQFRADSPHARIVEVDSNHNTRLKDYFLKNAPDLYGMKRAGSDENEYPMFTYPYMANLSHLGVIWVSGYGAAEYLYGEEYGKPPIRFIHGQTTASNASTAAKESKLNPETHLVRGHSHSMEMHTRTTRAGWYLSAIIVGALCRTTGEVPSYHSAVDDRGRPVHYQENWQQGVLVIRDHGGDYQFDHVPIREGIIYYNGVIYRGDLDETNSQQ